MEKNVISVNCSSKYNCMPVLSTISELCFVITYESIIYNWNEGGNNWQQFSM